MAQFQNDPFPGTDYSKYLEWAKVQLPSGETFYEVPGHPGYVFDPVASNATGRKVFRANPKGQVDAQNQQDELIKQQKFNQSPVGQLLPVAASTAGLYAASRLAQPGATALGLTDKGILMSDGTIKGASAINSTANAAAQGAQTTSNITSNVAGAGPNGISYAPPTGAGPGGYPLANAPGETVTPVLPGSETVSSWSTTPANGSFGQIAGAAAAAKGAYDSAKAWDNGGEGLRTGFTETGAGIGTLVAGPGLGTAVGAGLGNLAGYGMQGNGWKNHAALIANPMTWPLEAAKLAGFGPHKTTRQVAQEHTQDLLKQGTDDAAYQTYVKGMREQFNTGPTDKSKPFAGKYASWDEYKKGGLEAGDLTGVYGNIKTYGPEWAGLTQEQRQAITQANIDSGIYDSKKGEVEITNAEKAIENKNNVLKGFEIGAQTAAQPAPVPRPTTIPVTPAEAAAQSAIKGGPAIFRGRV